MDRQLKGDFRIGLLLLIGLDFLGLGSLVHAQQVQTKAGSGGEEDGRFSADQLPSIVRGLVKETSPGIVTVYALRGPRMTPAWRRREEAKRQYHGRERSHQLAESLSESLDDQGSGLVINEEGYVLTCNHVVEGANAVIVRTADGRKIPVKKFVGDPVTDLAVLQLSDSEDLKPVRFGDSDRLRVGDWIVSLASPYDLEQSVSVGIVSSTERWLPNSPLPMIQSDASTNPGSSGGALLNLQGEVVGIMEGCLTSTREFQGIGLAMSINAAREVAAQLKSSGFVQRGHFGFATQRLTADMAALLDLKADAGLYVTHVYPGSPTDIAGLREGDIVMSFNDKHIDGSFDPRTFSADSTPGKRHLFTVVRDGETLHIRAAMRLEQPWIDVPKSAVDTATKNSFEHYDEKLGLGLVNLDEKWIRELDLPTEASGVLITYVATDSVAYREGLAAGMIVARVNDRAISHLNEYRDNASKIRPSKRVLLLVRTATENIVVLLDINETLTEARNHE